MNKAEAARASREGMMRLNASLVERLANLGFAPGGNLNGLLSNSWAGRETSIAQAERALCGLRQRTLTYSQSAVVEALARAIDDAKRAHARPAPPPDEIHGTVRLSALLVPYPAARALRMLWRDGLPAPREVVEDALRAVRATAVESDRKSVV